MKDILVIGSLNMDLVATVDNLPQKGQTVFGKTFTIYPGGKGANQAVAAAKLGGRVTMVGCVGKDYYGEQLIQGLKDVNINTEFIRYCGIATGTALITVDNNGANTIVVVGGANLECSINDVDKALSGFKVPGILLIQHETNQETVSYAVKKAKQHGWLVILNPAPARSISDDVLACIDLITPNETEASTITGDTINTFSDAEQAAQKLLARGVKDVVITMGQQGALSMGSSGKYYIPAFKVQAVDTVAAGDAFSGALAAAIAENKTLKESLTFAAKAAAISVTRHGAQPALPFKHEVDMFEEMFKK